MKNCKTDHHVKIQRSSVKKCCTLALCTVVNHCGGFVLKWTVSLDCRLQVFSRISFPSVSDDPNYVATHFCRKTEILFWFRWNYCWFYEWLGFSLLKLMTLAAHLLFINFNDICTAMWLVLYLWELMEKVLVTNAIHIIRNRGYQTHEEANNSCDTGLAFQCGHLKS